MGKSCKGREEGKELFWHEKPGKNKGKDSLQHEAGKFEVGKEKVPMHAPPFAMGYQSEEGSHKENGPAQSIWHDKGFF